MPRIRTTWTPRSPWPPADFLALQVEIRRDGRDLMHDRNPRVTPAMMQGCRFAVVEGLDGPVLFRSSSVQACRAWASQNPPGGPVR